MQACALSLVLACATQPASEPASAEPAEPVVFVEAVPGPTQPTGPQPSPTTGPSELDRERAKSLFTEGMKRYEAGDIAGAVEHFEQAYQLVPLPALRFNIARSRAQLGDIAGACADYAELLADPEVTDGIRETATQELARLQC